MLTGSICLSVKSVRLEMNHMQQSSESWLSSTWFMDAAFPQITTPSQS